MNRIFEKRISVEKKIVMVICFALVICMTYVFKEEKFNSHKWKESSNKEKFVKDVILSKILITKTKDEVINILGTDCRHCSDTTYLNKTKYLEYIIAFEKSFVSSQASMNVLIINFKNEKTISVEYWENGIKKSRY